METGIIHLLKQLNEKTKMTNLNTQANRTAILDRIEKDGVRLSSFNKEQKIKIVKQYAVVCLSEGLIII